MQAKLRGAAAAGGALQRAPSSDFETAEAIAAQMAAGCSLARFLADAPLDATLAQWALDTDAALVHQDTMAHLQMLCDHLERAAEHVSGAQLDAARGRHASQRVVRTTTPRLCSTRALQLWRGGGVFT